jgi:AcrR family transcriptional regulator
MNTDDAMPEGWPYTRAKTALVRAAALVMRDQGPRAATLKNISQRAGVTEPAIFRHFDGVDGVFEGLCTAVEFFYDILNSSYASQEVKGLERYEQALHQIIEKLVEFKDFAYLIVYSPTIFHEYEDLRARIKTVRNRDRNQALACFKEAAKLGQIRSDVELETLAMATVAQIQLLFMTWLDGRDGFNLKDRCLRVWRDMKKVMEGKRK